GTAGARYHDRLTRLAAGDVEPRVHLRVRAVHAGRHLVRDLGRQQEHRVIGPQIEVLAESALEVRPLLARHEPVRLTHRTRFEMASEAGLAAPARKEVAVR